MAAINGTLCLLYSKGVVIAYQKGVSVSVETDLPDATNKQSAGWAEHIKGLRNAKIDFSSLFSASATPVMSANDLMNYIISRETLLVSILGLSAPIVGKADMNSLSFEAPMEGVMSLSGSLKIKDELYLLNGTHVNLLTDLYAGGVNYDVFTVDGVSIVSAINTAGAAYAKSNTFSVTNGDVLKMITFETKVSGEQPTMYIRNEAGGGSIGTLVTITEGLNLSTFAITATATATAMIENTDASSFGTSPIYLFKA